MTVKEILEMNKDKFDFAELYQYRDLFTYSRIPYHTDSVKFLASNDEDISDPPFDSYLDIEITAWTIMNFEEYDSSIMANASWADQDVYRETYEGKKILVMAVAYDTELPTS